MAGDGAAAAVDAIDEQPAQEVPDARAEADPEAPRFELDGAWFKVVCVEGVVPQHVAASGLSRVRLRYVDDEIAHFDVGGRRYALVIEPTVEPPAPTDSGFGDVELSDPRTRLTNRELQIVQLICMGLLTKQVADRLRISEFTVKSYLKTIYCKLGVRSRGAMVFRYAQAFRQGAKT